MRNQTLGQLKAMTRAELRQSSNPAVAQSADHILLNAIKGAQSWVHMAHSWPHMRTRKDITLEAGSYKYDWPAEIDYENVESVLTRYGDRWLPVTLFTEDDETYNAFDSEEDVRADPVLRYRILDDTQIEVWPSPTSAGRLRIKGLKRPPELNADAVKCPYDDQLISLVAAAKIVRDEGDRKSLMSQASALASRLTAKASTAVNFHIGGARSQPAIKQRELVVRVVRS